MQAKSMPKSRRKTQKPFQGKLRTEPASPSPTQVKPPSVDKAKNPPINQSSSPDSSGYCELSIIYTNDESIPEKINRKSDMGLILHARQSLIDLQCEAKNCLLTSKRALNEAKLRSSCLIPDSHLPDAPSPNAAAMLANLSASITQLSQRLSLTESVLIQRNDENSSLKSELSELQTKINKQTCKIDSQGVSAGCSSGCRLM